MLLSADERAAYTAYMEGTRTRHLLATMTYSRPSAQFFPRVHIGTAVVEIVVAVVAVVNRTIRRVAMAEAVSVAAAVVEGTEPCPTSRAAVSMCCGALMETLVALHGNKDGGAGNNLCGINGLPILKTH
jgi:hypothetical protein